MTAHAKSGNGLANEVHRGDVFADVAPKLGNLDVFWMNCVGIKRGAIGKCGDETSIVRAGQVKHVKTNGEAFHFRNDAREFLEKVYVFVSRKLFGVGAILPNNNVRKHLIFTRFLRVAARAQVSPRTARSSLMKSLIASPAKSIFLAFHTTRGGC
jgi:hypothetical protein